MTKKLTQKDVIDKCTEIFKGKYDYSSSVFVNTRTPIDIICPIHGKFSMPPKRHLRGQGCPECGKEYAKSWRKGDWKLFLEKFRNRFGDIFDFPNIEAQYENKYSELTMICKECGCKYSLSADYLLSDRFNGCKNCKYYFTFEQLSNANNTNNEMLQFEGKKDSRKDSVTLICQEHGEYEVKVNTLLEGKGKCIKCNGHQKLLTQEEAYKRLYNKFGNEIVPLSNYINSTTPMLFRCSKGHTFERDFNTAMFGNLTYPCPECTKIEISKRRTKTTGQFIQDAINVYGEDKYDFTNTKYTKSSEPVTIKCNECGRYFTIEANSFLQGHGCPYHNNNSSIMEKELAEYIKSLFNDTTQVLTNDRTLLGGMELDIYIPSKKIAFEFDGLFWHNENNKGQDYHINKTIKCEKKGVRLIHIFEDEWIEKKELVKSMICSFLDNLPNTIQRYNYSVSYNINTTVINEFLNKNCIHSIDCGEINICLLDKSHNIVSIASFNKVDTDTYELIYICNKLNTKVVDSEKFLMNEFCSTYKTEKIIISTDKRYPNNELYEKLGFKLENTTLPNSYYVINNKRYHETEINECKMNLNRIFDCGNDIFIWKNKGFFI